MMDQSGSLSSLFSNSVSFLTGLLAQNGSTSANATGPDALFSNLVSQDTPPSAPTTPLQAAASTTSSSASSTETSSSSSSGGSSADSATNSSSSLVQDLRTISALLHKTILLLRQKSNNAASGNGKAAQHANADNQDTHTKAATAQPATAPTTTASAADNTSAQSATTGTNAAPAETTGTATASTTGNNVTASAAPSTTDAAQTATASTDTDSTDTTQQITDIIAELLMMTQLVIRNLQQAQPTNGGTSSTQAVTQMSATASSPVTDAASQAADSLIAATPAPTVTPATTDTATPTDPILQLLKTLQEDTQLFDVAAPKSAPATSVAATASSTDTVSADTSAAAASVVQNAAAPLLAVDNLLPFGLTPKTAPAQENNQPAATTAVSTTDSTESAPIDTALLQLLKDLQKNIELVLTDKNSTPKTSGTPKTTQTNTATPDASADVAQLSTIAEDLKQTLNLLQQPAQSASTAKNALASTVQQATATLTATAVDLIPKAVTTAAGKQASDTAAQKQLYTTAVPVAPAATPTQTSVPTNIPTAVTAVGSKASGNADTDSSPDFLSGGGHSESFANTANFLGSGMTAGGAQAMGTYNFASTLSATRALNGGMTGLPSAVDQVILQLNRSVKSGNDQMSLQLHPGDLGKITVKLDFGSDGKVQGTVTADNANTLTMLQKDSRSLERALQDAGLRADPGSLQFNLSGQGNNNNAGQTANNGTGNSGASRNGTDSATNTTELADLGPIAETYYLTPSGVNIRV